MTEENAKSQSAINMLIFKFPVFEVILVNIILVASFDFYFNWRIIIKNLIIT